MSHAEQVRREVQKTAAFMREATSKNDRVESFDDKGHMCFWGANEPCQEEKHANSTKGGWKTRPQVTKTRRR